MKLYGISGRYKLCSRCIKFLNIFYRCMNANLRISRRHVTLKLEKSFALIQQLDSTRPWILDGSATKRSKLELKRWEHEND
jgi:hypothetical protein